MGRLNTPSNLPPGAPTAPPQPTASTPGPPGLISLDSHVDPLAFLGNLVEQYGDVCRYQTRMGACFLFVHPDHVQTILHRENYRRASLVKMMLGDGVLASDGPRWRSQRRLMQRDFLPPAIAPLLPAVTRETSRTASAWQAAARAGTVVNVTNEMTRLTLQIVVSALFSDDLADAHSQDLSAAVTQTINELGNLSWVIFGIPVHFTPETSASFAHGKKIIDTTCHNLVTRRRAQPPSERPRDLLTMLIEAQTPTGPMTDLQLRDEMVTMLVGGHETSALVLAWAWKLLAENPEMETRLHQEVDEVLAGRTPTMEDLPRLVWTAAIFQEAMRLYPPVWYMARVATDDDVVHGHAIPRNASVLVSAYFTHRHKDFWPNPERFDPARFVDPIASHRYAYFPFGGGRHQCLGMHFALMEGTVILAQVAQQFRVRPLNAESIHPVPGLTLRQSPELHATIHLRYPTSTTSGGL